MSHSLEETISGYESYRKKIAYYDILIKAAEDEIAEHDNGSRASVYHASKNLQKYITWRDHYDKELRKLNEITQGNHKYLDSMCSLSYEPDSHEENRLEELIYEFKKIVTVGGDTPVWKTMQRDGVLASEKDKQWYKELLKISAYPDYTRVHAISQLSNLDDDVARLAGSCHIQVESLSTRVRFVYEDNKAEPMANTYVLYWMYGEGDLADKLATDPVDISFFEKTNTMLPLGVGLTDEFGYLIQSTQIKDFDSKFHKIDKENATFEVKPNKLYGGWDVRSIAKDLGFYDLESQTLDPNYIKKVQTHLGSSWAEWHNSKHMERLLFNYNYIERLGTNRDMPALNTPARILHSYLKNGYYNGLEDEVEDELSLQSLEYFKAVSPQLFYGDRRYGFLAYPVNRGSFETKNLLELANSDDSPVWNGGSEGKGVPVSNDEDKEPEAIALHCTLPEWDRRLTVKLDRLNSEIKNIESKVKDHSNNLERINAMRMLASMHLQYPSEKRDDDQVTINENLIGELDLLHKGITERLIEPDEKADFLKPVDVEELEKSAEELWQMLKSEAFTKELNKYMQHTKKVYGSLFNDDGKYNPGPFNVEEPFWGHIFETMQVSLTSLAKTSIREAIWDEWVEGAVESLALMEDVSEVLDVIDRNDEYNDVVINSGLDGEDDRSKFSQEFYDTILYAAHSSNAKEAERIKALKQDYLSYEGLNPIVWAAFAWGQNAPGIFHKAPGPSSLVQSLIHVYSNEIAIAMTKKGPAFQIRFPLALFRLCGIYEIDGKRIPMSFMNKMTMIGYIAQTPTNKALEYIKGLRSIQEVKKVRVDTSIKDVLDSIAHEFINGSQSTPLENKIYEANSKRSYGLLMQVLTMAFQTASITTLKHQYASMPPFKASLMIMEAIASVTYSAGMAHRFFLQNTRYDISAAVASRSAGGAQVLKALAPENTVHLIGGFATILAFYSAYEQYEMGNDSAGDKKVAEASVIAMTHLVSIMEQQLRTQLAKKVGQAIALRVVGYTVLSLSVIGIVIMVLDVYHIYKQNSRTKLFDVYNFYLTEIKKSKVHYLADTPCHELYGNQLEGDYKRAYVNITEDDEDESKGDSEYVENYDEYDLKWGNLSWRAIVPLYLQGYSINVIESMTSLTSSTTQSTRIYPRAQSTEVRTTVTTKELIDYFNYINLPDNAEKSFPSGRKYPEVAEALVKGVFIPATGMKEELVIVQDGKEKILSFDFDYFREKATTKGVSWEESLEKSHKLYPTNYLT